MNAIKDELQHIIFGDGPFSQTNHLKKVRVFLRRRAETGFATQKQQHFKSKKAAKFLKLIEAVMVMSVGLIRCDVTRGLSTKLLFFETRWDKLRSDASGTGTQGWSYRLHRVLRWNLMIQLACDSRYNGCL
jgi:hypothetical protein